MLPALAEPPQVRQLSLLRTPEALQLSARLELKPTPVVQDALVKGVPLYFVWKADVFRQRWYWTNPRVASASRILRLAYQPLVRRWRVSLSTDEGAGSGGGAGLQYALHQTFDTLEEALASVGRAPRWRLADTAVLAPGADHHVEFSFRLDLSLLPRPFQIGLGNQPEWAVAFEQRLRVPESVTPEPRTEPEPGLLDPADAGVAGSDGEVPIGR